MKRSIVLAMVLGSLALPAVASAQSEEPPPGVARVGHVEGLTQYKWQGAAGVGANVTPFTGDGIECGTDPTDPTTLCDVSLVEFSYPMTEEEIAAGKTSHTRTGTISISNGGPFPDPPTDMDLQVLESDANGTAGAEVDTSGDLDADWARESVAVTVRTTPSQPSKWFLVRAIYFSSAGNSYFGQAGFDLPAGVDQGGRVALGETFTWEGVPTFALNHNYFGQYDVDPPSQVPHPGGQVPPYPEQVPDQLPAPPAWTTDVTGKSGTCSKDVNTYCEQVLVEYTNPLTPEEIAAGVTQKKKATTIRIDQWDPPHPVTDFDLIVYNSDAKGTIGSEIGQSAEGIFCACTDLNYEELRFNVTTTEAEPSKWVLVRIVFFQSPRTEYIGTVTF